MDAQQKPISSLVADLTDGVSRLVRQELELVRAETSEKASAATVGLIGIFGGMMVALASLLVLVQALVVALANHMPAEIAALVVGVGLAVIAFILIRVGQSRLDADALALSKTAKSLKQDKELVMETVR